jgi:hypothetical protein
MPWFSTVATKQTNVAEPGPLRLNGGADHASIGIDGRAWE